MDLRTIDRSTLEKLRKECVDAVTSGETHQQVADRLEIPRVTVSRWMKSFRQRGEAGLKSKVAPGKSPSLNQKELIRLASVLQKYTPCDLNISVSQLWTREYVAELIQREFGKVLGITTVGGILRRMGFSFQKPIRKAYQQDPEAVKKWLEEDYPEIRKEASASRASIYFADEAGIRSDHQAGQTWGKRGHTPVIRTTGARHRINAISAISRQGALRYMVFSGNLDANKFVEFLKRVMHKRRRPVTLILDGSSVHKSKSVKTYVDSLKGKLKLYFLPPYSPDLNPDELVWNHLKNHGVNRSKIEDKASFQKMVRAHLRSLLNKPEKIAGFFFKDSTKYAA